VLLLDLRGCTRLVAGLGAVAIVCATAVASGVFAGTSLGCCWTTVFAGTRFAKCIVITHANTRHAASAAILTRRTSRRRA
jgi:hypothetical protein